MITIKRAYLELEMEGVIQTRQGRGSFVADNAALGDSLKEQELDQHLSAAIQAGALAGITGEALVTRLREMEKIHGKKRS